MDDAKFRILSSRVLQCLDRARKLAMRAGSRIVSRDPIYGDATTMLEKAAALIQESADGVNGLTDAQQQMLWCRFGLIQAYIDYAELDEQPMSWPEWLATPEGIAARGRFPRGPLIAARRQANEHHRRAVAAAQQARAQRRESRRLIESSSRIVSEKALNDPSEDPLRNLCRLVKQQHGVPWRDRREKGGILLVEYMNQSDTTAGQLQAAGFTFSPTRGWWRK